MDVHSHGFEMKGLYLGTAEIMPLMILRARGEEKNNLRSVFGNQDKVSGKPDRVGLGALVKTDYKKDYSTEEIEVRISEEYRIERNNQTHISGDIEHLFSKTVSFSRSRLVNFQLFERKFPFKSKLILIYYALLMHGLSELAHFLIGSALISFYLNVGKNIVLP